MTKEQLIQLIHVAKGQLKIDEDTYRQLLITTTGKASCSKMKHGELEKVYQVFKDKGFKRKFKKHTHITAGKSRPVEMHAKIRAIWVTMSTHGFIQDSSENALNSYVRRMTVNHNNGIGVGIVAWLNEDLAGKVLESIKKWHLRLITEQLAAVPNCIDERGYLIVNGIRQKGYDALTEFYEQVRSAQHAKAKRTE